MEEIKKQKEKQKKNSNIGCLVITFVIVLIILVPILIKHSQWYCFRKAVKSDDIELYAQYVKQYPKGRYINEVATWFSSYYTARNMEKPMEQWSGAINNYEYIRDKYSFSPVIYNAIDSLLILKVDLSYNEIQSIDTEEAWSDYMKYMPKKYWRDAQEQKETCYERRWGTEEKAWSSAVESNTIESYERYLKLYPRGKHRSSADKACIDLTVDKIMGGFHGDMPKMNKYSNGGTSNNIQISNDTPYTLTVYYSGTSSQKVILMKGMTGFVSLPNGKYRVAASVDEKGVSSYAGEESLTGGRYSVSFYISRY